MVSYGILHLDRGSPSAGTLDVRVMLDRRARLHSGPSGLQVLA